MLTLVYLFVLDWRLALLSLAVFPVAFMFMMMVMGSYAKDYDGAVKATNAMSGAMIEYINGIEVIKAFNQGKKSYGRLIDKVRANARIITTGCGAVSWECPWPTPFFQRRC